MNSEVTEIVHYDKLNSTYFWTLMTIGGLCGLAIGYVTSLQIKVGYGFFQLCTNKLY